MTREAPYFEETPARIPSPFEVAANILDPPYLSDPIGWGIERLGQFLISYQREIALSVARNRYTAVKSCHDSGKSFIAALLACWWIDSRPPGSAFVVSTAPSWKQVKAILWREINRNFRVAEDTPAGPLPGRTNLDCEWYIGNELVGYGRKPQDSDQSAFQGIHARHVLVIADEAGGVPRSLYDAIDSLATNEDARVLAIGNPDDPESHFAKICAPNSGWHTIRIDGYSTPNFTDEPVPPELRKMLLSRTWVKERRARWGDQSPLFISRVRGDFPEISDLVIIPPSLITQAQERELPGISPGNYGADIARFGTDETVCYRNRDGQLRVAYSRFKQDTAQTADDLANILIIHRGGVPMAIDSVGIGAAVFDRLRQRNLPVVPFDASAAPIRKPQPGDPKFGNRRSEVWWEVREMFERREVDLDPEDLDLAAQLGSVRFRIDGKGIIWVETKEEWRKRMGTEIANSPDRADAAIMALVNRPGALVFPSIHSSEDSSLTGDLLTRPM